MNDTHESNSMKFHRRGFTLIELLVVISIIALLIGILLPVLSEVRYRAKVLGCMTTIKQLRVGLEAHATDNKGYYPAAPNGYPNTELTDLPMSVYRQLRDDYLQGMTSVLYCPFYYEQYGKEAIEGPTGKWCYGNPDGFRAEVGYMIHTNWRLDPELAPGLWRRDGRDMRVERNDHRDSDAVLISDYYQFQPANPTLFEEVPHIGDLDSSVGQLMPEGGNRAHLDGSVTYQRWPSASLIDMVNDANSFDNPDVLRYQFGSNWSYMLFW